MNNRVDQFIADPKKALWTLSGPIAIAMFVQTMYNIVDTAWVGRLGAEAIAALTFSFPIFMILIGLNSGIGAGLNSSISRALGARDVERAENAALHGVILALVLALACVLLGLPLLRPLFDNFGAAPAVIPQAMSYMSIILAGVLVMFPAYAVHTIFAAQGDTKTPMKVQVAGMVLNAILDPIFIYPLRMGVAGAALATDISIAVSLVLYLYFLRKKSLVRLHVRSFKFNFPICRQICRVGAPASLMMFLMSIYVMFINRFMAHFGTDYVAAFGMAVRLESFATIPIMALSLSLVTLVGMFYGAKQYALVKTISWYSIRLAVAITSAIGVLFYLLPRAFLRMFTDNWMLLTIGAAYLRVDVLTFPLMAVGATSSRIFQGLGRGLPSLTIQLVRIFVVAVPLAYVFVFVLGTGFIAVAWAMVLGGLASSLLSLVWLNSALNAVPRVDETNRP